MDRYRIQGFFLRPAWVLSIFPYKIATRRGARLNEVKVFNLYFRFLNRKVDATSIALMYRPPNKNEEWILLLPDDTKRRILEERRAFLDQARYYTLIKQVMDPNHQDNLITNLNELTVNERCAQSLIHEYGHVLHWRMFDALNLQTNKDVYIWFYENGYAHNVDRRYPNFLSLSPVEKVKILKESLVEDYRIHLNRKEKNGMFILPNRVSYLGDFINPKLLEEGVQIMDQMLRLAIENKAKFRKMGFSSELDTIETIHGISNRSIDINWTPGTPSMTEADHLRVIEQLEMEVAKL